MLKFILKYNKKIDLKYESFSGWINSINIENANNNIIIFSEGILKYSSLFFFPKAFMYTICNNQCGEGKLVSTSISLQHSYVWINKDMIEDLENKKLLIRIGD